jgi:serine/threonine protein kinase
MSETLLKGRYRHISELGRGEHTVAYKAHDILLDRIVVVKTLREPYASDAQAIEHFHRGARAIAALTHPNIVGIYDMGSDRDLHYLVTEYVEGQNLESALSSEPRMEAGQAVSIALDVCRGLEAAHQAGYIHGHLSPRNILLAAGGEVRISDFRVSQGPLLRRGEETPSSLYGAPYLSPEQAMGRRATAASDVYGAGVILYEMLAGRPPFRAESSDAIAEQHIRQEPALVHRIEPDVPSSLSFIVDMALAKTAANRYRRAGDFADALQEYQSRSGREEFVRPRSPDRPPEPMIQEPRPPSPQPPEALPAERSEPLLPEPSPGLDWPGCLLGVVSVVAVLGLIPLWLAVFLRYFG